MDYYKILNLNEDASIKEIEQAYLDLSSFYNPLNNVSKLAYKKYREVEKAYKVLKENKQREMYNLSRKEEVIGVKKISNEGKKIDESDFFSSILEKEEMDIFHYKDVIVEDTYSDYLKLSVSLPYLYYLTNSEYEIEFKKDVLEYTSRVCKSCLGIGKVKKDNKVVYCKECNGVGKEATKKEEIVKRNILIDEKVILNEDKVIIEFDFFDQNEYIVNGNEIIINHLVSYDEYHNGIKYALKNGDSSLIIDKKNFTINNDTYIFMDKIIKINWILSSYKGKDLKGYLITNRGVIYLNPHDYTFSYTPSEVCTYKVEIDSNLIVVNHLGGKGLNESNGDLILEVINCENKDNLKILFNKKIKKVSLSLFKLKGSYNDHYFNKKGSFDYDDDYIYIPSLAYKLKLKNFTLFKILASVLYLLIPLILFLLFGISYAFFISIFIVLVLYLILINVVMEVKV